MGRKSRTTEDGLRKCLDCGEYKPLDEFYRYQGYPSAYCKPCVKKRNHKRLVKRKGPKKNTPWTPEEDDILTCHYRSGMPTDEQLALLPGRSYGAIVGRASLLGIQTNNTGAPRKDPVHVCQAGIIASMKGGAGERGIKWHLSQKDAIQLMESPCHYCGRANGNVYRTKSGYEYRYNGIDRIDSGGNYTPTNVVPCCWECNNAKGGRNRSDFIKWIRQVFSHLNL